MTLIASALRLVFRLLYRVEVKGEAHAAAAGGAVIVANHGSRLDGMLLSLFVPGSCAIAADSRAVHSRLGRLAGRAFEIIPVDPANPLTLRPLVDILERGEKVAMFPEGRPTATGALMKIHATPAAIAHMAGAKLLPVRIEGAQFTPFSQLRGKLRLKWFPKITLEILPPVDIAVPDGLRGGALHDHLAERLHVIMTDMLFRTSPTGRTLFESLLEARAAHGGGHRIVEDVQRVPLDYNRLLLGSFILGRKIAALAPGQDYVGVLLPNAAGCFMTLMGLHASGRVPALLNYSTGAINMSAACAAASVKTIVTSRKFVEAGGFEADVDLLRARARIVYLEDVRAGIGLADKLRGLWARAFPMQALKSAGWKSDPDAPAAVLFTSGSEGVPKGVALSHRNLQANRFQAFARIDFTPRDIVFNPLPMFHAFGLMAGTLLPILAGVRTFLYPSPLHYKAIPELCYAIDATILMGTDTFLAGYARNAHSYDFYSMRLVVAGAERVRPETRALWMEKFGIRILEGYGATECSPALAFNTPMHFKSGTVGRMFDGIDYRLEPVEGIAEGGRLWVRGPNMMIGYLRADTPGVIERPPDGWYDTGDIVSVDAEGFLTILGRVKRFAKVGGEMVSLGAVEAQVQAAFPEASHAVVALPDIRKGEQLVLVTTDADLDRKSLATRLKTAGAIELAIPRSVLKVAEMPLLGSGKTDYVAIGRLVREKLAGA